MKLSLLATLLIATTALAMPAKPATTTSIKAPPPPANSGKAGGGGNANSKKITAAQIPDFGITPGVKSPNQPGSCVGDQSKNIPCACPPSKEVFASTLSTFVSRGKAGNTPITFSTDFNDQSKGTNLARINAMISAMQNLDFDKTGQAGRGCPVVAAPGLIRVRGDLQAGKSVRIG